MRPDNNNEFRIIDLFREDSVYDPRLVASVMSSAGFTRPANTTAYAAKDVMTDSVAKAMEFKNISPIPGAAVDILNAIMISSNPAASPGQFTLLMFSQPQDLAADNAAYAPTNQNMSRCVGIIVFDGYKANGVSCLYYPIGFGHLYTRLGPGQTSLWGVLVADAAYTPISVENFQIRLFGEIVR